MTTSNETLHWKDLQKSQCAISDVPNHVVMHGIFQHMMGEFYQRIILPMHHMMSQYMAYSNSSSNGEKKEVQFYIRDPTNPNPRRILDSQRLYTLGLPFGDTLHTWNREVHKPWCQCYSRLVFCGHKVDTSTNSSLTSERGELTLLPDYKVRDNTNKYCNADYGQKKLALETEDCDVWQDLRISLIKTYERIYPAMNQDVSIYREYLIKNALGTTFSPSFVLGDFIHHDWKIIGLSQRSDRRKWLNINDTLSHCNTRYHAKKIVCVEVDVANLPTNFIGTGTNNYLSSVEEQMVLYRSIDSLIGIHGSQVGVLMLSVYYSSNHHMFVLNTETTVNTGSTYETKLNHDRNFSVVSKTMGC